MYRPSDQNAQMGPTTLLHQSEGSPVSTNKFLLTIHHMIIYQHVTYLYIIYNSLFSFTIINHLHSLKLTVRP